jgi:hypothetical protein
MHIHRYNLHVYNIFSKAMMLADQIKAWTNGENFINNKLIKNASNKSMFVFAKK